MPQGNDSVDDLPSDAEIRDLSAFGRASEQLTLKKQRLREARRALWLAQEKSGADEDLIRLRLGDVRNRIERVNRQIDLLHETFQATQAPEEEEVKALRDAVRALRNAVATAQTWVELLDLAAGALEEVLQPAVGGVAGGNGGATDG